MQNMITRLLLIACLVALAGAVVRAQSKDEFSQLPFLKTYTQERISSYDRTGANDDGQRKNAIKPGETRAIGDVEGPGVITHMWFTIDAPERYHLKKIVLRMYWDGDPLPAVEAPIGDFFGLGMGEYFMYESGPLSVGSQKALNCYFPMPFRRSARITITNEGSRPISAFYYNLDWPQAPQPAGGRRVLLRRVPAGDAHARLDGGLEAELRQEGG